MAHVHVIEMLIELFKPGSDKKYKVRCQMPLTLGDSEPEPDFAVVDRRKAARAPRHPTSALLVVEVASDSLARDLDVKARLYARAGVTEYWVVDVEHQAVEVHRKPSPKTGTWRQRSRAGKELRPTAALLAGVTVPVAPLFRRRAR